MSDRQAAYDAVYTYIRNLDEYLPPDPAHRNAVIWRGVQAALDAYEDEPNHHPSPDGNWCDGCDDTWPCEAARDRGAHRE